MPEFKKNDYVVCIDDSGCVGIVKGQTYRVDTVEGSNLWIVESIGVLFISVTAPFGPYQDYRFELKFPFRPKEKVKLKQNVILPTDSILSYNETYEVESLSTDFAANGYNIEEIITVRLKGIDFPSPAKYFELSVSGPKVCTCTTNQLMWGGCICGAFKQEKVDKG